MRISNAVRLTAALLMTAAVGSGVARADLTAIVPAYFYPSPGSAWDDMNTAAARIPVTAIMNPFNGPGNSLDGNYVNAVDSLRAAGGKVIGYVRTNYGSEPSAVVKANIDKYVNWYNIDGIFFDEMTNTGTAGTLNYYEDIYNYAKAINPTWEVMGNPGINTTESYLTRPVADSLLVFESQGSSYPGNTPSSWNANYDPSQLGHLVHSAPNEADMLNYLDLAVQRNAGQVYITNDVLNNPWDTLPTYWEAEVDRIEAINNGVIIIPPTNGQTMSNPVANGSITTIGTDRSDWAAIPAYGPDTSETGGAEVDYDQVQIAHDDDNFYLRMQLNSSEALGFKHNVYIDTDFDPSTGFTGGSGELAIGADYLLQGSSVFAFTGGSPTTWGWSFLSTQQSNATPNTDIETRIPRSLIGNPDGFDFTLWSDNSVAADDYYPNIGLDGFRYLVDGPLAGDLDGDGFVGIGDLNLILSNWNLSVTPGDLTSGDFDGDGFVGITDLNGVLGNWNAGTPPGEYANIPEPTTLLILGVCVPTILRRRSR